MCGRYALGIRASFVRYQLQQQGHQVDDAPADDVARETYNFPPGAYGLVYRADIPDHGVRDQDHTEAPVHSEGVEAGENVDFLPEEAPKSSQAHHGEYKYHLKAMKWGLIPFWTKRSPDYGSMLRTINCRDDSLLENRGMWNTMKQKKRCIVICQGFYEWLKKGPNGKEKVPHFVKRKDGQLMCFAGLWDCVQYEDVEEKLYTYSIITTDSNKQLSFLHDRMPVILDAGSDAIKVWLDPERNKWSRELQALLKPYEGHLECYPVSKDVGKVGNNSPDFIVPIDSKENKKNIANFFGNTKKINGAESEVKDPEHAKVEHETVEDRQTKDQESTEDNAPLPVPAKEEDESKLATKRGHSPDDNEGAAMKKVKVKSSPTKQEQSKITVTPGRKTRSATSNEAIAKKMSPKKKTASDGTQRITSFLQK